MEHAFAGLIALPLPLDELPQRRTSTPAERALMGEIIARAIASLEEPAKRVVTCCRCERLADAARERREPFQHAQPVERWTHQGRTFFSGTCAGCADFEWSAWWQRRHDAASQANDSRAMRALTALAEERQRRGRKLHLNLPRIQ